MGAAAPAGGDVVGGEEGWRVPALPGTHTALLRPHQTHRTKPVEPLGNHQLWGK